MRFEESWNGHTQPLDVIVTIATDRILKGVIKDSFNPSL